MRQKPQREEIFQVERIEIPEEELVSLEKDDAKITNRVVVPFAHFAQLIANHDYQRVVRGNEEEEIVLSSTLLTDLAAAHEEEEKQRPQLIFAAGLILGIVLAYFIITF